MIIVLTGPPGAGKGTQADLLVAEKKYRKLSTGDALRKHIKEETKIGKIAKDIVSRGELVPDDILFQVLKEELGNNPKEVVILDGYPRNLNQANTLETLKNIHPVKMALQLDVAKEELIPRISGRRTCPKCTATYHITANPSKKGDSCEKCNAALVQRPDDNPVQVKTRLEVYDSSTKPILDFYKEKGVFYKVKGTGTTSEIFRDLLKLINSVM